jgi:hypothetical protein
MQQEPHPQLLFMYPESQPKHLLILMHHMQQPQLQFHAYEGTTIIYIQVGFYSLFELLLLILSPSLSC